MVPVYNTHFNRSLCPSDSLVMKHGEFFRGWSAANKRITPEETYKEVDRLKTSDAMFDEDTVEEMVKERQFVLVAKSV